MPVSGELLPNVIESCGVKYIFVGHPERQFFIGEDTDTISVKLNSILSYKNISGQKPLLPILCLIEDPKIRENFKQKIAPEEKENTNTQEYKEYRKEANEDVAKRLETYLSGLDAKDFKKLSESVIAYESLWATNDPSEKSPLHPESINETAKVIRNKVYEIAIKDKGLSKDEANKIKNQIRIIYGSYINEKNIDNYLTDNCSELDGILVGRPGLKTTVFNPIIRKIAVKYNELLKTEKPSI